MPKPYKLCKVGTDSELFLTDIKTGAPVPVIGLLGGTKANPLPVLGGYGFAVQEDNVMPEFNIPACGSYEEWTVYLRMMLTHLRREFNSKGLEIVAASSMEFSPKDLEHPQARTFGCEPDFNAWTLEENVVDSSSDEARCLRTAGGHVHVSFTKNGEPPQLEDQIRMVKALDICLGTFSSVLDTDTRRHLLYGKAGAFRPKPYGVEYRVLSNFWLRREVWRRFIWHGVHCAIRTLNGEGNIDSTLDAEMSRIEDTINRKHGNHLDYFRKRFPIWDPRAEEVFEAWEPSTRSVEIQI